MFKVLKDDGWCLLTDKGSILITQFEEAEGQPPTVSAKDLAEMRTLFTAAPAMLAALKRVVSWMDETGGPPSAKSIRKAREAIKLAERGQKVRR